MSALVLVLRRALPRVAIVRPDVLPPVLVVQWGAWVGAWSVGWLGGGR